MYVDKDDFENYYEIFEQECDYFFPAELTNIDATIKIILYTFEALEYNISEGELALFYVKTGLMSYYVPLINNGRLL